jgi:uncharacterized membrane protein YccC
MTVTDQQMANAIRALAMDAVQAANSGHPGMPMGMADVATVLYSKFLKFDPKAPHWADRDRFVLSAGHGSMFAYATLYLTGYASPTIEDIKNALRLAESAAEAAFNERDSLTRENERLHAHLDELTASTIHSCGDHCQRPNCVRRREMAAMREAIQEAYDAIKASPYPDQQAIDKLKLFTTDTP